MCKQHQNQAKGLARTRTNEGKAGRPTILLATIILSALACGGLFSKGTQFKPVYLDRKTAGFIVSDEDLSYAFKKRLKQVLIENNISYREEGDHIFIPTDKWADTDLMWNLTNKVYDPAWCPSPLTPQPG